MRAAQLLAVNLCITCTKHRETPQASRSLASPSVANVPFALSRSMMEAGLGVDERGLSPQCTIQALK